MNRRHMDNENESSIQEELIAPSHALNPCSEAFCLGFCIVAAVLVLIITNGAIGAH